MAILLWLAIPLIMTALAILVIGSRSRSEGPGEGGHGVHDFDRLRAAMARPMPPATPIPGAGTQGRDASAA
ncbi:unannotated protein [freshwater metagenome]|uniref:Unannotated protein n=1 Tax=freshwater metagenome TaxID=449393 RepID=A0A6J7PI28_9ZZZZ